MNLYYVMAYPREVLGVYPTLKMATDKMLEWKRTMMTFDVYIVQIRDIEEKTIEAIQIEMIHAEQDFVENCLEEVKFFDDGKDPLGIFKALEEEPDLEF